MDSTGSKLLLTVCRYTVMSVVKIYISRGFRKQFIPGRDDSCTELINEFQRTEDSNRADKLISTLNKKISQRWCEITENLDFKHSSYKTWILLKKLRATNLSKKKQESINYNGVAVRLTSMGKLTMDKKHERIIKSELRCRNKTLEKKIRFTFGIFHIWGSK